MASSPQKLCLGSLPARVMYDLARHIFLGGNYGETRRPVRKAMNSSRREVMNKKSSVGKGQTGEMLIGFVQGTSKVTMSPLSNSDN